MKHIFLVALIIGLAILTRAQAEYEVSGEGTNKVYKGLISRDVLEKDTTFRWFSAGSRVYTPSAEEVATLKAHSAELQFLVFIGTWNEESHYILPRFYTLLDAAGFSRDRVTLIGVDRDKRTVNDLTNKLHIDRIPTIIVLRKDRELGRIGDPANDPHWERQLEDLLKLP